MRNTLRYILTAAIVLTAVGLIFWRYHDYLLNPWTRDGRVMANVIQVAPRVSGPVIELPIRDNQRVKAGDLLFIDSSHILMPGSDVDLLLNRVLPRLPNRCLVHIHDVFLPFDYPRHWGWRAYNEQQGVVPLLTSGAFRPLFSSVWAERRMADRLAASVISRLPRPPDALPASLWLEKR